METEDNQAVKLLLVEDDPELSGMMREFLGSEGFVVSAVQRGDEVLAAVQNETPDLMVLDMMLPGFDGLEVCRQLRKTYHFPILMLTARDDDLLEVASLREGADNYLTKPIRPHVLMAHIQAMLRRDKSDIPETSVSEPTVQHDVKVQDLALDTGSYRVFKQGQELNFSQGEFKILLCLHQHLGQAVSRGALYQQVRGIPYDGLDRSIDLQVSAIRRKLGDETPPYKYIRALRGQGYCLLG